MSGEGARARRDSDKITLQLSRKTLIAIVTAVLAASGGAYYKSDRAQSAADEVQAVAVQAETKTDASYQVGVTRDVAQENDLTRLVKAHNELVAEVKRLRKICAPRKKVAEPALAPVVLTPKPPLPATPEAAAAAVTP